MAGPVEWRGHAVVWGILFFRFFRRREPWPRWLLVGVVACGPLSVVGGAAAA